MKLLHGKVKCTKFILIFTRGIYISQLLDICTSTCTSNVFVFQLWNFFFLVLCLVIIEVCCIIEYASLIAVSCFDRTSLFKRQKLRSSIGMCSQRTQQGTAPVIPAISAKKRSILFPWRVHLSRFYQTSTSFLRNIFHPFTLLQHSWISSHCTHLFYCTC